MDMLGMVCPLKSQHELIRIRRQRELKYVNGFVNIYGTRRQNTSVSTKVHTR